MRFWIVLILSCSACALPPKTTPPPPETGVVINTPTTDVDIIRIPFSLPDGVRICVQGDHGFECAQLSEVRQFIFGRLKANE